MGLLALTWYAYVSIIAGAIVAVGGALTVLAGWRRAIAGMVRRLIRSRGQRIQTAMPEAADQPTEAQRAVLNAVYQHFVEHGSRPAFRLIDQELDRAGIELRKHAESMPAGLLLPDVRMRGGFFRLEDELMVTIEGLGYCRGGEAALDLLARVLGYLAKREKEFVPTGAERDLLVGSDEVGQALALSPLEIAQSRLLLDAFEWQVWLSATSGDDGRWTVTLNLERVRRFRGVETGDEYLQARTGEHSFAHRLAV